MAAAFSSSSSSSSSASSSTNTSASASAPADAGAKSHLEFLMEQRVLRDSAVKAERDSLRESTEQYLQKLGSTISTFFKICEEFMDEKSLSVSDEKLINYCTYADYATPACESPGMVAAIDADEFSQTITFRFIGVLMESIIRAKSLVFEKCLQMFTSNSTIRSVLQNGKPPVLAGLIGSVGSVKQDQNMKLTLLQEVYEIFKSLLKYNGTTMIPSDDDAKSRQLFGMLKRWVLEAGEFTHFADKKDELLLMAIFHNDVEFVSYLVSRGANVMCNNGEAMLTTLFSGSMDMARLLISYGYTLSSRMLGDMLLCICNFQNSPSSTMSEDGAVKFVQFIFDTYKAGVVSQDTKDTKSPAAATATTMPHPHPPHPLVRTSGLVDHWCNGCKVTVTTAYRCAPCNWDLCDSCYTKSPVCGSTGAGDTTSAASSPTHDFETACQKALQLATDGNNVKVVDQLLKCGLKDSVRNGVYDNLSYTCVLGDKRIDMIRTFLSYVPKTAEGVATLNGDNCFLMRLALGCDTLSYGSADSTIKALLDAGASATHYEKYLTTSSFLSAVKTGDGGLLERLMHYQGDKKLEQAYLDELFILACKYGHVSMMKQLAHYGANPKARNNIALTTAAGAGKMDVVTCLVELMGKGSM